MYLRKHFPTFFFRVVKKVIFDPIWLFFSRVFSKVGKYNYEETIIVGKNLQLYFVWILPGLYIAALSFV